MVAFSCNGDSDDNSTDFSASAPSSSSSSSKNEKENSEQLVRQQVQLMQRKVTFSDIQIWEFDTCVGDNRSLSSGGCPVALASKHTRMTTMPVDKAEALRLSPFHYRRTLQELMLDRDTREEQLLASGCTRRDIAAGVRKARKERHVRDQCHCNHGGEWDKVHEAIETARRKLTKPFRTAASR